MSSGGAQLRRVGGKVDGGGVVTRDGAASPETGGAFPAADTRGRS